MQKTISVFIILLILAVSMACSSPEIVVLPEPGSWEPAQSVKVAQARVKELAAENLVVRTGEFLKLAITDTSDGPAPTQLNGKPFPSHKGTSLKKDVDRFYRKRDYRPAWVTPEGFREEVHSLIGVLVNAPSHGLEPEDYATVKITGIVNSTQQAFAGDTELPQAEDLAELDIMLTEAFIIYGYHLGHGRVPEGTTDQFWVNGKKKEDFSSLLQSALDTGRIQKTLEGLAPRHEGYKRLQETLVRYLEIAENGRWPYIRRGATLKRGSRGRRVEALRKRLAGAVANIPTSGTFDRKLERAVKTFQRTSGLTPDGVVGPHTRALLNISIEDRIKQISMNLERWRWLPPDLGDRYIAVNIANFELDVVEDGKSVLNMEAIVGNDYRRTPSFSDKMTYLVLSPYWNVPETIAVEDKLPLIKRDPEYLTRNAYDLVRGWGRNEEVVDPLTVDWNSISEENFPYRLRQRPGPYNALGRVKFMFHNPFGIYIHDTPQRSLFNRKKRTFSSGCIRVSKPIKLAEYLLKDAPGWDRYAILRTMIKWKHYEVRIPKAIPIHLLYFTAWVDEDGQLNFREDIYGRDSELYSVLQGNPQESAFLSQ